MWLILIVMILSALGGAACMGMVMMDRMERRGKDGIRNRPGE